MDDLLHHLHDVLRGFYANGGCVSNALGNLATASTNFPPLQNVFASGPPPTGALRLTRQGPTLTAWYLDGATWVPLQSRTIVADEVDATLDVFSNAPPFTHGPVKVAFDNFRITSGTMSCPTWWDDNAPDWQAVR